MLAVSSLFESPDFQAALESFITDRFPGIIQLKTSGPIRSANDVEVIALGIISRRISVKKYYPVSEISGWFLDLMSLGIPAAHKDRIKQMERRFEEAITSLEIPGKQINKGVLKQTAPHYRGLQWQGIIQHVLDRGANV